MSHTCHIDNCNTVVPPKMLMCKSHWAQVPAVLKQAVLAHYRTGQEKDKSVSLEWVRAARAAINSVSAALPPASIRDAHYTHNAYSDQEKRT